VAVAAVADPATAYKFELYELSKDWTQFTDVSAPTRRRCNRYGT
jgi:arylsulfatase